MYSETPVLSLISAALTLVPLIWYLRARNIAAVVIGVWLSVTNLIYAVDALVWAENTDIKAVAWCDIGELYLVSYHRSLVLTELDSAKGPFLLPVRVLRCPQRACPSVSIWNVWLLRIKTPHLKPNDDESWSSV